VPPSNVFYVSIETAYHNGIINGYPGGYFLPNQNIRRDQMAQIVYEGIIHRPGSMTNTPVPATNTPMATVTPGTVMVSVVDFAFNPQTITVTLGTTVMWTNTGTFTHTVTADDNSFNSGDMGNGATFSHTFNTIGTVGYHCIHHGLPGSGMYGTVVVVSLLKPEDNR
jgi:plastocyanin